MVKHVTESYIYWRSHAQQRSLYVRWDVSLHHKTSCDCPSLAETRAVVTLDDWLRCDCWRYFDGLRCLLNSLNFLQKFRHRGCNALPVFRKRTLYGRPKELQAWLQNNNGHVSILTTIYTFGTAIMICFLYLVTMLAFVFYK